MFKKKMLLATAVIAAFNNVAFAATDLGSITTNPVVQQTMTQANPVQTIEKNSIAVKPSEQSEDSLIDKWKKSDLWHYLEDCFDSAYDTIVSWFQKSETDRDNIANIRKKHIDLYEQEKLQKRPDFNKITQAITVETKKWIGSIIDNIFEEMNIQKPDGFSVFTLGSMARGESGFFTDLEVGFLVNDNALTIQTYTDLINVSTELNRRLFFLGEHPDYHGYGMRLDEASNAPFYMRFGYDNLTPSEAKRLLKEAILNRDFSTIPSAGSRLFITTPSRLALHTDSNFINQVDKLFPDSANRQKGSQLRHDEIAAEFNRQRADKKNAHLSDDRLMEHINFIYDQIHKHFSLKDAKESNQIITLGRNIDFLSGNEDTYKVFLEKNRAALSGNAVRDELFTERRKEVAIESMKEHLIRWMDDGKSVPNIGALKGKVDIKRDLYRIMEQTVTNLGFYFDTKSQNGKEIIRELVKRKIMSKRTARQILDYMNHIMGLRLKKQNILQSQAHAVYISQEDFNEDLASLEKERDTLQKSYDYLKSTNPTKIQLAKAKKALDAKIHQITDLKKVAPGKILSDDDVKRLNEKYMPILQRVFKKAQAWVLGNDNAFGGKGAAVGFK